MMEHLCPKCGYLWEDEDVSPTPEMKKAVKDHLAGKYDSVFGALMAQRSHVDEARMRRCQQQADPADLARFRRGELLQGEIKVGDIYEWEPDMSFPSGTIQITRIVEDRIWAISSDISQGFWNEESRVREACVRSAVKILPPAIGKRHE